MSPQPYGHGDQRAAVILEALTWIRTPFEYGQCVKGAGVDCGRFLAASFNAAGVTQIPIEKLARLSPQWFMHRSDESFLDEIRPFAAEYRLATPVLQELWSGPTKSKPEPADIVVAKCGRDWAHSALVIAWPRVIAAACEHVVTIWQDIFRSPQYMNRDLRFFDVFAAEQP